jgi:hypothetical protein
MYGFVRQEFLRSRCESRAAKPRKSAELAAAMEVLGLHSYAHNPYARVWPVVPVAREPRPSVTGASGPGVRVPAFQKDKLWERERVQ